jgi:hypothetical protein
VKEPPARLAQKPQPLAYATRIGWRSRMKPSGVVGLTLLALAVLGLIVLAVGVAFGDSP